MTWRLGLAAALFLLVGGAASADPPGAIGRLSYIEGGVSFRGADQEEWAAAVVNRPVTAHDAVSTEANSRAEIQIGPALLFMDGGTALMIGRLDDEATELQLGEGTVNIDVPVLSDGSLRVVTRHMAVSLVQPGRYRLQAGDRSEVAVLDGEARVEAGDTRALHAGESASIGGDASGIIIAAASPTPFDAWALGRSRRAPASETAQYVSPNTTGYQDLDRFGRWSTAPSYGPVWYPNEVPVGWAPYRYGHWAFVPPWGWTWVDDAPWGFAPFHYGRWVVIRDRWAWWPGPRVRRPVYAPALVVFMSAGNSRPARWIPLAPYEAFHPHYRASPAYVRNVNVTTVHRTDINRMTVNNVRHASADRFANRHAITEVRPREHERTRPARHRHEEVLHRDPAPPLSAPRAAPQPSHDRWRFESRGRDKAAAQPVAEPRPVPRAREAERSRPMPTRRDEAVRRDPPPQAARPQATPVPMREPPSEVRAQPPRGHERSQAATSTPQPPRAAPPALRTPPQGLQATPQPPRQRDRADRPQREIRDKETPRERKQKS